MKSMLLSALLVIVVPVSYANAGFVVRMELVPTDMDGNPISTISTGEDFLLNVVVQDIRDSDPPLDGVFGAYLDIQFDANVASFPADVPPIWPPTFGNGKGLDDRSTPSLINGIGAFATSFVPPGNDPQLLVQLPGTAVRAGVVDFTPLFDTTPGNDVAVYGSDDPVLASEIEFVGSTLNVVPEPSSFALVGPTASVLAVLGLGRRRARIH